MLRAWLHAAEGAVLATGGHRDASLRALDAATAVLPDRPDATLPYLMLDAGHLARWRGQCLARLGEDSAITDPTDALDTTDADRSSRAEAGLRVDLALALQAQNDVTESRRQAQRAAELAVRTGSRRQRRRIDALLAN